MHAEKIEIITAGGCGKTGPWRFLRRWLPISFAVALTALMGSADAWAKGNATPVVVSTPTAPREPTRQEQIELALDVVQSTGATFDRYAERERASQALEAFQGGDAVVITSSTILIILLIILILAVL